MRGASRSRAPAAGDSPAARPTTLELTPQEAAAHNLRALRERHGLSQGRLAEALRAGRILSWTQATVADVEGGHRHLRGEEILALALFFRVGPEQLMAPQRGTVRLGLDVRADLVSLTAFLTARGDDVRPAARRILPRGRGVEAFSGTRSHAPISPKALGEERGWAEDGGDIAELRLQRDRLWRGEITSQQYAAWRRHARARLLTRKGTHGQNSG